MTDTGHTNKKHLLLLLCRCGFKVRCRFLASVDIYNVNLLPVLESAKHIGDLPILHSVDQIHVTCRLQMLHYDTMCLCMWRSSSGLKLVSHSLSFPPFATEGYNTLIYYFFLRKLHVYNGQMHVVNKNPRRNNLYHYPLNKHHLVELRPTRFSCDCVEWCKLTRSHCNNRCKILMFNISASFSCKYQTCCGDTDRVSSKSQVTVVWKEQDKSNQR